MAVCHTCSTSSEGLRKVSSEEHQDPEKSNRRARANTLCWKRLTLLEAANLIKQRPLGRIPNDPDDGSYVCPNDMLLGRSLSTVPQGPFRETNNRRHRAEFV